MHTASTRTSGVFVYPGGDQPVCGSFVCDCVTAWFVALLGVWNSSCVLFVSVGVLVAGRAWLCVVGCGCSGSFVTVLFENCIVDASIFFFDAIL